MNNKSVYTSIIAAKNGTEIPVLSNGRTVDSKYNPDREAENIIDSLNISNNNSYFFVVIGIGSGTLISKLSEKFNLSKIVCIENNLDDIIFLSQLDTIKNLQKNSNIVLTDIEHIEEVLINNYLPALYDDFKIIEQKGWINNNQEIIPLLNKKINKAIGIISADYSVQAHFGKIWQSNILNNLKIQSTFSNKQFSNPDINKTAAIIAAGPSLDKNINKLKENKSNYYIIATDTAFKVLLNNSIIPDVVVSIDGQHISHNHFSNVNKCNKTIFLLDLCSDYSVGNYLKSKKLDICYFISGHPLSSLANSFSEENFPFLFSGAGTVTITALDFAINNGFKNIEVYGADFSYINGKPYSKGTYFDTIFGSQNNKLFTLEKNYSKLMFRTELNKISENIYSTDILNAYKMSMEQYLNDNKCLFSKEENIYKIKSTKTNKNIETLKSFPYNFDNFISNIKKIKLEELKYPLLPYIGWMKNVKYKESLEFIALLKLAQSNIVRYN